MTAAPTYLWQLGGQPPHPAAEDTAEPVICLCCGTLTNLRTIAPKAALGVSYDYTQALRRDAHRVCEPCAWALAGKPPATLRMWSIAATAHRDLPASHPKCAVDLGPQVHLTNRADMRTVAAILTDPPAGEWLVTIAVSGQKHVVPYAATCHGSGPWRIRMETLTVTSDPAEFAGLLGRVTALRTAGFGPDQIATVDPGTSLSTRDRLTAWRTHAEPLTPYRGSPVLHLASLIPTKEHLHDYLDRYSTPA